MRFTQALFAVVSVALVGCQNASMSSAPLPAPVVAPAQGDSAVREPAADFGRRGSFALTAAAAPASAVPWPASAVPWSYAALPLVGALAPATASACKAASAGAAACKALVNLSDPIIAIANSDASLLVGVSPALLRHIYDLPSTGGSSETVGIVVAYDDPNLESDLGVYRSTFGMSACTTANRCFHKMAATGKLPAADAGWSVEASLDVEAVSATCPQCKILVVEAASNQISDLATAVDAAVAGGANVVSNSYGVAEASDNVGYASHYQHAGVPITASAGDVGYGVQFPASVPAVTAVGGTSVQQTTTSSLQEVTWTHSGSGCSSFFAKPAWQHDTGCAHRTVNDIGLMADPNDGISVYDSTLPGTAHGGWSVIGGTSLGAPVAASMYALAATSQLGTNTSIYAAARNANASDPALLDVTSGGDGTCAPAYFCTAIVGYDAPTGNGAPWGLGAFAP